MPTNPVCFDYAWINCMTVHSSRFSGTDLLSFYQKDLDHNNSGGLFCFAFLDEYYYMQKQLYVTRHTRFQLHLQKSIDAFVKNILIQDILVSLDIFLIISLRFFFCFHRPCFYFELHIEDGSSQDILLKRQKVFTYLGIILFEERPTTQKIKWQTKEH